MELEGDGPAPRHSAPPEPTGTQNLHVTPENVVTLAKTFLDCADRLEGELPHLETDMALSWSWMEDPVSRWARQRFDEYFVDGAHSFVHIVQSEYQQHKAISEALRTTAQLYGLTEELITAGFEDLG
jgi:hypothetical protein